MSATPKIPNFGLPIGLIFVKDAATCTKPAGSDVFRQKSVDQNRKKLYTLMLRVYSLFALAFGFFCLTAFRAENPKCNDQPFPNNSTAAHFSSCRVCRYSPSQQFRVKPEVDSNTVLNILMFNYNAYDSAYVAKVRRAIEEQLPASPVSEFWQGDWKDLNLALATTDVVVITYPFGGDAGSVRAFGKQLTQFARQGGMVIITGTDDFRILQQFGLFGVEFSYFCSEPVVHEVTPEHPVLNGTGNQFSLSDFVYPIDVTDPDFVTLVDVSGYKEDDSPVSCWTATREETDPASLRNFPVVGYKPIGSGKVVYLGMEYYQDQAEPAQILINTIRWSSAKPVQGSRQNTNRVAKRSEEVLHAGSGADHAVLFDLKIYPNPYYEKATLDIELKNATALEVEMTDENGRITAILLPQKSLSAGFYRMELPNVSPGVYFVRCKTGDKTSVRKVVKTASR